jgi:hypothetical protein
MVNLVFIWCLLGGSPSCVIFSSFSVRDESSKYYLPTVILKGKLRIDLVTNNLKLFTI